MERRGGLALSAENMDAILRRLPTEGLVRLEPISERIREMVSQDYLWNRMARKDGLTGFVRKEGESSREFIERMDVRKLWAVNRYSIMVRELVMSAGQEPLSFLETGGVTYVLVERNPGSELIVNVYRGNHSSHGGACSSYCHRSMTSDSPGWKMENDKVKPCGLPSHSSPVQDRMGQNIISTPYVTCENLLVSKKPPHHARRWMETGTPERPIRGLGDGCVVRKAIMTLRGPVLFYEDLEVCGARLMVDEGEGGYTVETPIYEIRTRVGMTGDCSLCETPSFTMYCQLVKDEDAVERCRLHVQRDYFDGGKIEYSLSVSPCADGLLFPQSTGAVVLMSGSGREDGIPNQIVSLREDGRPESVKLRTGMSGVECLAYEGKTVMYDDEKGTLRVGAQKHDIYFSRLGGETRKQGGARRNQGRRIVIPGGTRLGVKVSEDRIMLCEFGKGGA